MILAGSMAACTPEEFSGLSEKGLPQASEFESLVKVEADLRTNEITATYTGDETEDFFWKVVPAKGKEEILTEATWTKKYKNAGDYEVSFYVKNRNGLSDPIKTVVTLEKDMTGFYGFDANGENNLWNKANVSFRNTYYAHGDGWEGYADGSLGHTEGNNVYVATLPYESNQQWQAQYQLATTLDNSLVPADATYDMSCVVTSTKNLTGMTIKLTDDNDKAAIVDERINLVAGETYVFYVLDKPGIDLSEAPLKLVFDFGGCAAETEVTIENVCIIDHSKNTELGKVPAEEKDPIVWDEAANLLTPAMLGDVTTYYAHGEGWEGYDEYTHSYADGVHKLSLPNPTDLRWQAQYTINNTGVELDPNAQYDFRVKVVASKDVKGMTVKLTQQDNDNVFLTEGTHDVTAFEDCWIELGGLSFNNPELAINNLKIVFDFGGNEGGIDVEISDFLLQPHAGAKAHAPFEYDSEDNLWKAASPALSEIYIGDGGWAPYPADQSSCNLSKESITFKVTPATDMQWKAQLKINTGITNLDPAKNYDFHCVMTGNADMGSVTVKLCELGPNDTPGSLGINYDANTVLYNTDTKLIAEEEVSVKIYDQPGIQLQDNPLMIVFDFGGNPANFEVEITDIVIREAK